MRKWKHSLLHCAMSGSAIRRLLFLSILLIAVIVNIRFMMKETHWESLYSLSRSPTHPKEHKEPPTTKTSMYDEQALVAKVGILYGDSKPIYERAFQTHKVHNRIHGYPFFIQRESILDGYWTKPAHLQTVVLNELEKSQQRRLKWLFWVDADTVVLNYQTPLEAFLPPEGDKSLANVKVLVSEDWNGLNNGVFAIRVDKYAVELFAGILSFRDFRANIDLPFQDQSAMEMVLQQPKFAKHKVVVPQRWFNAYKSNKDEDLQTFQVRQGDFLVHFAGVGERERHMMEWCELSERRDPEWNKILPEMNYPREIQEFWEEVKAKRAEITQQWKDGKRRLQDLHDAAKMMAEEKKTKQEGESLGALSEILVKAERYLEETKTTEDDERAEDDVEAVESLIRDLQNKANASAKMG